MANDESRGQLDPLFLSFIITGLRRMHRWRVNRSPRARGRYRLFHGLSRTKSPATNYTKKTPRRMSENIWEKIRLIREIRGKFLDVRVNLSAADGAAVVCGGNGQTFPSLKPIL